MRGFALSSAAAAALLVSNGAAKTPVSQTVFNNILHYSQYAAAAYGDECPTPPFGSQVLSYYNNNSTDAQATLFLNNNSKEIIISFRGTSSPTDLDTDIFFALVPLTVAGAKCSACRVHSGFQSSYQSIATAVNADIKSAMAAHSGYSLIVNGHSLGAGMAGIASASFAAQGIKVTGYTYGEPRNGNLAFAKYVNSLIPTSNYFRVTHYNDGVPQIPPPVLGYVHHGTEYWLSEMGNSTAATTYECPGQQATDCNASTTYGDDPIDAAHLYYANALIANSLHIAACGATTP